MTTSEPDGTPTTPKPTRRRRTPAATAAPDVLPVERTASEPAAAPPAPPATPPEIEEDGAWIEADAVEVDRSVIGRVDATDVAVTRGVIGAARADRVSLEMGREVSVSQGAATTILAQNVRVEQAFVRTMVAQEVTIHRPSAVLFLIAQRVSGDVKVLLDWRGAIAFGAAFGILAGLFGRGRGRRRDRG